MIVKDGEGDLPPPYSALILPSAQSAVVPENGIAPAVSSNNNTFENKNARVIFIQKVLSIFLMQTVAVDIVFETFFYVRIFRRNFNLLFFLLGSVTFYMFSIALLIKCYQARQKFPFNYVILVYQPIAVAIISVLVLRAILGMNIMAEDILEMISFAWKAYIISSPVNLLYSVFCQDSQHEFKLKNCIFITTAVFGVTSLYIIPYASGIFNGSVAVFSTMAVLYPNYLYILYDIVAMTKPDYHETMTPSDYVNGAVNLSFDIFIIIKNFITRIIIRWCCCVDRDREPSTSEE